MSRKRPPSPSPTLPSPPPTAPSPKPAEVRAISSPPGASEHRTFRSSPIKDRSSTFIAVYSPTLSFKTLQATPEFKTATHRIAAWRKPSAQRSISGSQNRIYDTGHDDDGEQYGGKRLEKVLNEMDVEGAVMVARWYGGVLLGPVRFTHIENCAREAIGKWKLEAAGSARRAGEDGDAAQKRRKVEDEEKDRVRLAKLLQERDHSIFALRCLLKDKMEEVSPAGPSDKSEAERKESITSPTKLVNYSAMPLLALKRLEKAKDATIAWILQEIDKSEKQQQEGRDEGTAKDNG
jgi:Uncharacterized protein family UPF0029